MNNRNTTSTSTVSRVAPVWLTEAERRISERADGVGCCVHVTYQAGEGVGHAVLQSAALQNGEQGGVVEATRRRRDQLLHPLTLRRIQTWTRHTEETRIMVLDLFGFREGSL